MSVAEIALRLERWVGTEPALPELDPATAAFCRRKLREMPGALADKVACELGNRRRVPLGRVLIVIAEHDVLGSVAGVVGAHVTGNRVRVKARTTRALVADLMAALDIDGELLDWSSQDQDDAAVLDGVDGVLLAGGDALIRHYRRVTPPGVRLIELGPKLSCAAIGSDPGDLDQLADALVADVTLFGQGVCSSLQMILIEPELVGAMYERVLARLPHCPPHADPLRQLARAQELRLLARLGEDISVHVDRTSGWGITCSPDLARRLPKGFAFVVGELGAKLDAVARAYPRALQTLGTAGQVPDRAEFTHRCRIGRMHERSPLEPHDGFLELQALVKLVSREA